MIQLDARTKVCLLIFANYLLLKRVTIGVEFALVCLLIYLFVASHKWKQAMSYAGVFILLYIVDIFLLVHLSGRLATFVAVLCVGGRMMLPCFMAGSYLLHTTSVYDLMHALRKWHVPETLLLIFAVVMRFLPTIREDYHTLRSTLALRGYFLSRYAILKQPIRFFEYVTIPLLMNLGRRIQDLTSALLTKSLHKDSNKTYYYAKNMTKSDMIVLVLLISSVVAIEMRWLV